MDEKIEILSSKVYAIMRKKSEDTETDPRTSEAMDRMCIASAKLRGSEFVEEKDLERVVKILSHTYLASSDYPDIKREIDFQEMKNE